MRSVALASRGKAFAPRLHSMGMAMYDGTLVYQGVHSDIRRALRHEGGVSPRRSTEAITCNIAAGVRKSALKFGTI